MFQRLASLWRNLRHRDTVDRDLRREECGPPRVIGRMSFFLQEFRRIAFGPGRVAA